MQNHDAELIEEATATETTVEENAPESIEAASEPTEGQAV